MKKLPDFLTIAIFLFIAIAVSSFIYDFLCSIASFKAFIACQ